MSKIEFGNNNCVGKTRWVPIYAGGDAELNSYDGGEWLFEPDSKNSISTSELRALADKLDELNRKDENGYRDTYRERVESSLIEKDGTTAQGA
jgi:hypothetical protein